MCVVVVFFVGGGMGGGLALLVVGVATGVVSVLFIGGGGGGTLGAQSKLIICWGEEFMATLSQHVHTLVLSWPHDQLRRACLPVGPPS